MTSNENEKDKSEFENFWGFLRYLLTDQRGILTLAIIFSSLIGIFFFIFYFARPQKIEITSNGGSISFKGGDEQGTILSLSPTGGKDSEWVETGIQVKKDDKVRVTATGRVNVSLKNLIYSVQNDEISEYLWSGPEGLEKNPESQPENRKKHKIKQELGYGALLSAIQDDRGDLDIIPICNEHEFTSKSDGDLLLTVNDIWLSEDMKEVYAPNFQENEEYYRTKAKKAIPLSNEDFDKLTDKEKSKEAKKAYEKRLKTWDKISSKEHPYWNVWYDDNVGAFSVVITINSKQTDPLKRSCSMSGSSVDNKTPR